MSVNKERLKALADAGSRGRKAYRQLQKLVQEAFLQARSGEQSWEQAMRQLFELGQEHLLWPQAAVDAAVIEVEQERLRLTWSKNELSKKASEKRRREAGAQARQATAPQAPAQAFQPEAKPFQLTAQELEEIRQLRSKYEGPGPKAGAKPQELEPGKDPFTEEQS
jgi:hypothetical protein